MKNFSLISFIFISGLFLLLPARMKAQEGNHCAVKKSPFRISMEAGNKIFISQCTSCHPADSLKSSGSALVLSGKGVSGDKEKMVVIMIRGHAIAESGNGNNSRGSMPAHPDMKDQDIADVLTFIRNSFGNKESPVKVSDVKSARSKLN
jgi:mono/diheme cytochrome c family protein